jgi:hypothetical protein
MDMLAPEGRRPPATSCGRWKILREMNRSESGLPKFVPTGFVRQCWAPYVLPGGLIDRRHHELCALSELRDRLRAGDVWVAGSRQNRSLEERLIAAETMREQQQAGTFPITVNGRTDLANRRSGAVHQATRLAHSASGREGRCP